MAASLKRRREAVSYKEPSSDEDFSEDSSTEYTSRNRRTAPQRRSARHHPTESEEPSTKRTRPGSSSNNNASPAPSRKVPLRGRHKVSYRESSSDSDSDADFEDQEVTSPRQSQRERAPRTTTPRKAGQSKSTRSRPLGAPLKPKTTPQRIPTPSRNIISDGIIPPWATLPYHVLLQIFVYASHPLHDDNLTPTPSIAWLSRTARICSTFTKPALTALYRNPPIFAIRQNRKELVQHLINPTLEGREDHSVMVKRLELDATRMSKLTDPQSSVSDLAVLVSSLKTLKEIDIFDPFDKPPYRERSRRIRRWYYPDELFTALHHSELRLRSWRWNSTYFSKDFIWVKEIHATKAFENLRELSLTKFHPKPPKKSEEADTEPTNEELLGSTLSALPNLRSLSFESCLVVNGRLLPLLPNNLVSLNITNCRDVISDALQAFLTTHGKRLEELILNHNQSLDLSFLVGLKEYCPRLEVLKMDMHYYNTLSTSSDNEPLWDYLLPEGEVPSWPTSLTTIDLQFLRNWSSDLAIAFFTSLIESAEDLPWLRDIVIIAIVDVDWRQRAEFRRKWTARFQKCFARKSPAPNPNLESLKAFRESKVLQKEATEDKNDSLIETVNEGPADEPPAVEDTDSDAPLLPSQRQRADEKWDTKRLRSRAQTSPNYDESSSGSDSENESDTEDVKYIQGMCYNVVFKIDNSRPQEQIYAEDDFLDTEVSGDEDWNGNDVVEDEYAW